MNEACSNESISFVSAEPTGAWALPTLGCTPQLRTLLFEPLYLELATAADRPQRTETADNIFLCPLPAPYVRRWGRARNRAMLETSSLSAAADPKHSFTITSP